MFACLCVSLFKKTKLSSAQLSPSHGPLLCQIPVPEALVSHQQAAGRPLPPATSLPACCSTTTALIKQHTSSRKQLHTGGGVKTGFASVCVCACVWVRVCFLSGCPSALRALEGDVKNANEVNHQSKD